uniref:Uncharacterized protein n=1 Tax=Glossina austeni TaxID=7395 RepID=A0A1A9VSS3_GLOAU
MIFFISQSGLSGVDIRYLISSKSSFLLHLGNIKFANKYKKDKEKLYLEGRDIYLDDLHLRVMGELLLIKADEL